MLPVLSKTRCCHEARRLQGSENGSESILVPRQTPTPQSPEMATSRSIVALCVLTSFPEGTGIVEPKRAPPDRAESGSLAESVALATMQQCRSNSEPSSRTRSERQDLSGRPYSPSSDSTSTASPPRPGLGPRGSRHERQSRRCPHRHRDHVYVAFARSATTVGADRRFAQADPGCPRQPPLLEGTSHDADYPLSTQPHPAV